MGYAIETFNLTKVFPDFENPFAFRKIDKKVVLKDINIQVRPGEIFCIIGPNGSGKTTLLKILATLIAPTSGSAKIAGFDIEKDEEKVKASIGLVVGAERSIYWRLTGRENLEFYAILHRLNQREIIKEIGILSEILELGDFLDKKVMEYSTGMRQRLCLARGLLNHPRVLLLDEPTKSLDIQAANNLRNLIRKELVQKMGVTVVFSTHQQDEVRFLSDRVALIENGSIKVIKKPEEVEFFC